MRRALLLAICMALVGSCKGRPKHDNRQIRVETDIVKLVDAVPPSRHILPLRPVRQSNLSPRYGGVVATIDFTPQVRVPKGTVLVRFVNSEARARLATARAGLTVAEATYRGKQVERVRTERLTKEGLGSAQQLDQVVAEERVLRARVDEVRATLAEAEDRLQATLLVAPFDGTVVEYGIYPGDYVDPLSTAGSSGRPMLVFADLSEFYVDVPLTEREAVLYDKGELRMESTLRGAAIRTEPVWLGRAASATTSRVTARLRIPDQDGGLRIGESVEVTVSSKRGATTLAIPATALRWHRGTSFVFRIHADGQQLEEVPVDVLADHADRVTVRSTLIEGDRVVIGGPASLSPGTPVEAIHPR